MIQWISVKDKLPKDGDIVLCCYQGVYAYRVVSFWEDIQGLPHFGIPSETDGKGSQPATHWMPLPEPPK